MLLRFSENCRSRSLRSEDQRVYGLGRLREQFVEVFGFPDDGGGVALFAERAK